MYLKSMSRGIMKEMELKHLKRLSGLLALKQTITQLLLSVSILSLVFSWSSLSSSTSVYYQNLHYFSSNICHITSIAMNKNFIFLICNGILVILAKTSALPHPPLPSDHDDLLQNRTRNGLQVEIEAETYSDKHIKLDEEEEEKEEEEEEEEEDEDDDDDDVTNVYEGEEVKVDREFEHSSTRALQVSISIAESEDDEIELRDSCLFKDVDDRDQEVVCNGGEVVDEIEKLSDDELNQKFEDFIRKMKEEFRFNDYQQKQLILVK